MQAEYYFALCNTATDSVPLANNVAGQRVTVASPGLLSIETERAIHDEYPVLPSLQDCSTGLCVGVKLGVGGSDGRPFSNSHDSIEDEDLFRNVATR